MICVFLAFELCQFNEAIPNIDNFHGSISFHTIREVAWNLLLMFPLLSFVLGNGYHITLPVILWQTDYVFVRDIAYYNLNRKYLNTRFFPPSGEEYELLKMRNSPPPNQHPQFTALKKSRYLIIIFSMITRITYRK